MGNVIGEKEERGKKDRVRESQERLRNTQRDTERLEETYRVTVDKGDKEDKEKQRETDRDTERLTETQRDRQRQRENL